MVQMCSLINQTPSHTLQEIDEKRKILVAKTEDDAIGFCTNQFYDLANKAIASSGVFTVALSGGSTPKKLYRQILLQSKKHILEWNNVLFFWSDERAVAPTHPDSNYHMAMQFFDQAPIIDAKKFRMPADAMDMESASSEYESLIKQLCPDKKFDLVYLGVGEDGHTASLFPGTEALNEKKKLVVAQFVPSKNSWRMTFTFSCINQAKKIDVIALGESKAEILKQVLQPDQNAKDLPARHIGTKNSPALFICDKSAASKLVLPT